MTNIFDSHAHYDDRRFDGDRDAVLSSLPEKGVCGVLNAACNMKSTMESIRLSEKYGFVFASAGVHPHDAKDAPGDLALKLEEFSKHPKVVAIGETGLDYHYDFSPREKQLEVFETHIKASLELDLPLIVHDREAHADTLRLLKKYRPRGIVHCYSGSAEMARELLKLGLYIGFTGVVTFKNARKTLEAAEAVPMERLLVETDCPYMSPEPYRGRRCDSSMIEFTALALAAVKKITVQELLEETRKNALAVYGINEQAV